MTDAPTPEESLSRLEKRRAGIGDGEAPKLPERGLKRLALTQLEPNPFNERKTYDDLDTLAKSLRERGQQEPLIVEPTDSGRYRIISGHRRYMAAARAGLKQLDCVIRRAAKTRGDRILNSLTSNLQRANVRPVEFAEALLAAKTETGLINKDIGVQLGKSDQWISEALLVAKLPDDTKSILKETKAEVPLSVAVEVARVKDPDAQQELAERAAQGLTVSEARAAKKAAQGEKNVASKRKGARLSYPLDNVTVTVAFKARREPSTEHIVSALEAALRAAKEQ